MSGPLLTTKLHIPQARTASVPRPHLIMRLQQGLAHKLILISAPAGYGKTTLLSEWLADCGQTTAWVSIDKGDNDPGRFWGYVLAALQSAFSLSGSTLPDLLPSANLSPNETLIIELINELDKLPQPLILVLDDYHLITTQAIHDGLSFLLERAPRHFHLVIATRADPPLPLARLRARSQLVELRLADLRFAAQEISEFLRKGMGLSLSETDLSLLETSTEGWIAGIQMAGLSLQGRVDYSSFIHSFSGEDRYILDYLFDEVFQQQSTDLQEFLLQTAVLERLCAPLCSAVTNHENSQAILVFLEQKNLFLIPLDGERRWYRYHHLFQDLLRIRLKRSRPNQVGLLHCRASEWYEEQGFIIEAVQHALVAEDAERVARLVEKNVMEMIEHGNLGYIVKGLQSLPNEEVRSRPWLCIIRAWALAHTGAFEMVTPCLLDASQALADKELAPAEVAHIRGHIDMIRCYELNLTGGDHQLAIELAHNALAELPESDWRARGLMTVMLGIANRHKMDYAAAHEALAKGLAIARAANQKYVVIDVLCQIALVQNDQGHLRQAAATCREVLNLADAYHLRLPVVSYALCTLSEIHREWNDLNTALDLAQDALVLARKWGQADSLSNGYYNVIMAQIARREFDKAFETIQERTQLAFTSRWPSPRRRQIFLESMTHLAMEDIKSATQCLAGLGSDADEDWRMQRLIPVYIAQFRHGLRASLADVIDYLAQALLVAELATSRRNMVQILVLQAMALQAVGEIESAHAALLRALRLAETDGYVRTFIAFGNPIRELLKKILGTQRANRDAVAQRTAVYVSQLLETLANESPAEIPVLTNPSHLVEPLSEREIQVLQLLSQGFSDKKIAGTLVIARETVHKHLKNIYGKLGVHSRTEAIVHARELGVL